MFFLPAKKNTPNSYSNKNSETYKEPTGGVQYLDIEFGTGELKGPQGVDDFHIGPFTVI